MNNAQLNLIKDKTKDWFTSLSRREQAIVGFGTIGLLIFVIYSIVITPVFDFLAAQESKVEATYKELQAVPHVLARYDRVRTRRAEIEKLYKSIEMPEGAFAYLEALVRDKAGIPATGFTIKEGIARKFGNIYEQVPYNIQYKITDYGKLIVFLQELVEGKRPFIVNRVSLTKARQGDHLDVDLEVSSVRRTS